MPVGAEEENAAAFQPLVQVDRLWRKQELTSSKSFDVKYYKMMEMGSRPIVKYEK